MKRYSKVVILLVLLAMICVAIYAVNRHEEKKEEIESTDEIILQIDADEVTSLSWEVTDASDDTEESDESDTSDDTEKSDESDTAFAFHKDDKWVYDEDENFPVNQEKINDILAVFSEMGASFAISDVEDYDQYGLEDPKCTIHFEAGDKEYEVKLGDYSTMDEERYVSIGDGKVYLLSSDPFDTFNVELSGLIQNDDVPVLSQISTVTFSGAADYTIYENDTNNVSYSDEDKYFTDAEGDTIAMDTSLVDSYLGSIEGLDLSNYVTYNATDDELNEYGLDTPELTATVEYTEAEVTEDAEDTESASDGTEETDTESDDADANDGELSTFVISVARSAEDQSAEDATEDSETDTTDSTDSSDTDSSDEDTEYAYVRIGDSKIIYSISEDTYQTLMKANVSDLRHQKLVWADTDDIYQIDVTIDGTSYVLKSENAPEEDAVDTEDTEATTEVTTTESDASDESDQTDSDEEEEIKWYYSTEEVDAASVQSALSSLTATEFTTDTPTGKEELSMTLYIDNANVSEVIITFYRYDGTTCLAEVNGEPIAYVSRSSVVDMIEAVNEIVLMKD